MELNKSEGEGKSEKRELKKERNGVLKEKKEKMKREGGDFLSLA